MKKGKIALSVLVLCSFVATFAFSNKTSHQSFLTWKLYYISESPYQRLQHGHITETDLMERTIVESMIRDTAAYHYWQDWQQTSFTPTSDNQKYIGYIQFTLDINTDGDDDGALTRQEVVDAVWAKYESSGFEMPSAFYVDANNNSQSAVVFMVFATLAH